MLLKTNHHASQPYTAPTTYPEGGPMHQLFSRLLTKENVDSLGFVDWEKVKGLVDRAFTKEDAFALRQAMIVGQWITIGQRFGCKRAGLEEQKDHNLVETKVG